MRKRIPPPDDYLPFEAIPIRHVIVGDGAAKMALHLSGTLDDKRTPVVCVPGYCRNMADFADFLVLFHQLGEYDWPLVLVDLLGRGRSDDRKNPRNYTTTNDGNELASAMASLGIQKAVFLGQDHGGQVIMTLGAAHAHLIAGTILVDCAPLTHTPGLVRMRDNYLMMEKMATRSQFLSIAHKAMARSYPAASQNELDYLIARSHFVDEKGRTIAMFDLALLKRLQSLKFDDLFEARWPFFDLLGGKPLMLMRTQLGDLLLPDSFEQMAQLRSDAIQLVIAGQGSPALLSGADEVGAIVDFVANASKQARLDPVVCG